MRTLLVALFFSAVAAQARPVTLTASDGLKVYGEYVPSPEGSTRPLIVLFHQASANRSEYAPIQPKLRALGFGSLAIDQRSGGSLFGGHNQTAAALKHPVPYQAAMPDLEAALAFGAAHSPTHRAVVWGSSYSASLVFPLAAAHPDEVAAVMAFSPGEYFRDRHEIRRAAAKLTVPIFVTSAPTPGEIHRARIILDASPSKRKVQLVPKFGVHGASILRRDRDPKGADRAWRAVKAFLLRLP